MLLRVMPSKPRSRAMASRSNGNRCPPARRAERQHVGAPASFPEALAIAGEHFEIRQQVMRPEHRLRTPHMGIAGDHRAGIGSARSSSAPISPHSSPRARSHSARSHSRVSSDTCSFRLRPVWIFSATAPAVS